MKLIKLFILFIKNKTLLLYIFDLIKKHNVTLNLKNKTFSFTCLKEEEIKKISWELFYLDKNNNLLVTELKYKIKIIIIK